MSSRVNLKRDALQHALSFLLGVALLLSATSGLAAVHRFAVVVGNNTGADTDVPLRYAESDAAKVGRVLRSLGNFSPANVVLLQNESSNTFRSTLIALNDRIRAMQSSPADQALLFVYYSGHADAESLRQGRTRLRFQELAQLVRGSAATFRLLVVDSCRSGTLTRVKGGQIVAPFAITTERRLPGQGMAFLTASSANEDAQESDELKGSFFTHALVSGLLGAADSDADGTVVLEEAYQHARDATVRATSRTYAGTQHPTFQYEVRGQDSLVLTRPNSVGNRSQVVFPEGVDFLVMADNASGPVVGEVGASDGGRSLNLPPGNYYIRGRGQEYLLEGSIGVSAGESRAVRTDELNRLAFAHLVRKGAGRVSYAQSVEAGGAARTQFPNASSPCVGLTAGYQLDLESASFSTLIGACRSYLRNAAIEATSDEYAWTVGGARIWDFTSLSLSVGMAAGVSVTHQSFETAGHAPSRWSLSPLLSVHLGLSTLITESVALSVRVGPEAQLQRLQEDALSAEQLRAAFALRGALVFSRRF